MRRLYFTLFAAFVLFFAGCAALEKLDSDSLLLQVTASQSSARFVQGVGPDQWEERAIEVIRIIELTRLYVETDQSVTVTALIDMADNAIPWERLTPADEALIRELYVFYSHRLRDRLGTGELSEEAKVSVLSLLAAFERGATPYLR